MTDFRTTGTTLALAAAVSMAAVAGTALAFEHVWGYMPCALCLKERLPYYAGIATMLAAAAAFAGARPSVGRVLCVAAVALMTVGAILGIYHSGVEWRWWEGPSGCSASVALTTSGNLLADLDAVHPPSCTDAAGRFLGLSFAGWNVLSSLGCAVLAGLPLVGRQGLLSGRGPRRFPAPAGGRS